MAYRDDFRETERETYWTLPKVFVLLLVLISFGVLLKIVALPLWFASRTVDVVKRQVDPAELLRKYELFKDESAQLDAKLANIKVKAKGIKSIQAIPADKLDRTNREQMMLWEQEFEGMKYSYNALAADYNAQMSKINYRFCNIGDLPQGATQVLPREYKPYEEE